MQSQTIRCSESTLYKVASMTVTNLKKDLSDFTAYSPSYSMDTVKNLQDKIKAAQEIPSGADRTKNQVQSRTVMLESHKMAYTKWRTLKSYIVKGYQDEGLRMLMVNTAGALYAGDITKNNWEKMSAMLTAGIEFLKDNGAFLIDNKIMPATFADELKAAALDFETKWSEYLSEVNNTGTKALSNKKANLVLLDILTDIFADGKVIYMNDEEQRKLYTFDFLVEIVEGKARTASKKPTTVEETPTTPSKVADA